VAFDVLVAFDALVGALGELVAFDVLVAFYALVGALAAHRLPDAAATWLILAHLYLHL
jgi:hypothetical protein